MKGYLEFREALGKRESSDNYQCVNSLGYLGRYQFGKPRLWDFGYSIDGWQPKWSKEQIKNYPVVIINKEDFLKNANLQNDIFLAHVKDAIRQIKRHKLNEYIGKTILGIEITLSGLVAGFHLKGIGSEKKDKNGKWTAPGIKHFVKYEYDNADAYGTKISEYISKFAGYDLTNLL